MLTKFVKSKSGETWTVIHNGMYIGSWGTPKKARHKARMWRMWLNTGDKTYLRKEQ